jgi:hypothetical protein
MLTAGAGTVTATSGTLMHIPPGPSVIMLSNAGTASPVWVGPGTAVAAGLGFPVPSGAPVALPVYPAGAGSPLAAVTTSGTATVGWFISTASGGTGP